MHATFFFFKGGCRTYRKTLSERNKHTATPVKKKKQERSRKQRVRHFSFITYLEILLSVPTQSYERRGKVVKEGKETSLWLDVKPEMMSEEEKDGEVYIRHAPSYRSDSLNRFICKLDHRLETGKHPRMDRRLGSPRDKPVPAGCKKWIVKRELWKNNNDEATEEPADDAFANESDSDFSQD